MPNIIFPFEKSRSGPPELFCTIGYTDTDIHGLSIGIGTDTDTNPKIVSAIPIVSVSVSVSRIDR